MEVKKTGSPSNGGLTGNEEQRSRFPASGELNITKSRARSSRSPQRGRILRRTSERIASKVSMFERKASESNSPSGYRSPSHTSPRGSKNKLRVLSIESLGSVMGIDVLSSPVDDSYKDMVLMPKLDTTSVLENIQKRFQNRRIYTNVANICIAVNPYRDLGLYTRRYYEAYHYTKPDESINAPHIFQVARRAFRQMTSGISASNQSILISGESGAGKTEATKQLIRYFAEMSKRIRRPGDPITPISRSRSGGRSMEGSPLRSSCSSSSSRSSSITRTTIEKKIIEANPVLEAFGNAKTIRNDNSSRFGKWTDINFSPSGRLKSASIKRYLLEESRVVHQEKGERNFNIFYQVCAHLQRGGTSSDRNQFDLLNLRFLNQSSCFSVKRDEHQMYLETTQAMRNLGITKMEETSVMNILKGILLLGNISFEEGPDKNGKSTSQLSQDSRFLASRCARFFAVNDADFKDLLTIQGMTIRTGSVYKLPRSKEEAMNICHSLAKGLYGKLFAWIVMRINESLGDIPKTTRGLSNAQEGKYSRKRIDLHTKKIGILDIFGFEVMEKNSFEQLCINLANEKLQRYFIKKVFEVQLEMYKKEGIDMREIKYPDNSNTLALLERRGGVFQMLRDQLKIKTGSDKAFVQKLHSAQENHPKYVKPRGSADPHFTIKHYAGDVKYDSRGFIDKNRTKLTSDVEDFISTSKNPVVLGLFNKSLNGKQLPSSTLKRRLEMKFNKGHNAKASSGNISSNSVNTNSQSLAQQFQNSLSELLTSIQATESHFVRCIKPNSNKGEEEFDEKLVSRQLQTSGVVDAIGLRKYGYDIHLTHKEFYWKLRSIRISSDPLVPGKDFSRSLLERSSSLRENLRTSEKKNRIDLPVWQIGERMVFAKSIILRPLEQLLQKERIKSTIRIQAFLRACRVRQKTFKDLSEAYRALKISSSTSSLEKALKTAKLAGVPNHLLLEPRTRFELLRPFSLSLRKRTKSLKLTIQEIKGTPNVPQVVKIPYLNELEFAFKACETAIESLQKVEKIAVLNITISTLKKAFSEIGACMLGIQKCAEVQAADKRVKNMDEVSSKLSKLASEGKIEELDIALRTAKKKKLARSSIIYVSESSLKKLREEKERKDKIAKKERQDEIKRIENEKLKQREVKSEKVEKEIIMKDLERKKANANGKILNKEESISERMGEEKTTSSVSINSSMICEDENSEGPRGVEGKDFVTLRVSLRPVELSDVIKTALFMRIKELNDGQKLALITQSFSKESSMESEVVTNAIDFVRTHENCSSNLRSMMGQVMDAHRRQSYRGRRQEVLVNSETAPARIFQRDSGKISRSSSRSPGLENTRLRSSKLRASPRPAMRKINSSPQYIVADDPSGLGFITRSEPTCSTNSNIAVPKIQAILDDDNNMRSSSPTDFTAAMDELKLDLPSLSVPSQIDNENYLSSPQARVSAIREIRTPTADIPAPNKKSIFLPLGKGPPVLNTPDDRDGKLQMIFDKYDSDKDDRLACHELLSLLKASQKAAGEVEKAFTEEDYDLFCEAVDANPEEGVDVKQLGKIYELGDGDVHFDWKNLGFGEENSLSHQNSSQLLLPRRSSHRRGKSLSQTVDAISKSLYTFKSGKRKHRRRSSLAQSFANFGQKVSHFSLKLHLTTLERDLAIHATKRSTRSL